MRSTLIIISSLIVLSSCTMPWSKTATPKPVEYSTTQYDSPAAQYCTQNGGAVSIEKNPSNSTMELIYCTPKGGEKIDAWKYMDIKTTATGATIIGTGGAL